MATQLQHTDFNPVPAQPRPNIRVAFSNGSAVQAVAAAMEQVPAEIAQATLDELALADQVEVLIAKAKELLSPRMYTAFLRWSETAAQLSTFIGEDEEASRVCELNSAAMRQVCSVQPINVHDLAIKAHLLALEGADSSSFGPLSAGEDNELLVERLSLAIGRDLGWFSPLPDMQNDLATLAWRMSSGSRTAFTPKVGGIIVSAFSCARDAEGMERETQAPAPVDMTNYSPFMRGPLMAWQRTYADFLDHEERCASEDASEQEWAHRTSIMISLCLLPAPSPAELAVKLQLFAREGGSDLVRANEIIEQLAHDTRRFARFGPYVQSDQELFDAFRAYRVETREAMEAAYDSEEAEKASDERMMAAEQRLLDDRARTIEGAIAKLRVSWQRSLDDRWATHAVLDPRNAEFRKGLDMSDMFVRMGWGAIEDLARLAHVSLSEEVA